MYKIKYKKNHHFQALFDSQKIWWKMFGKENRKEKQKKRKNEEKKNQ